MIKGLKTNWQWARRLARQMPALIWGNVTRGKVDFLLKPVSRSMGGRYLAALRETHPLLVLKHRCGA
ncbi:MAG: hypothetical protein DHS20C08_08730 [Rhodomicrobium sp.]|nr:MAG: hypothetical protein DHS20C08_08730 [Rhodomicrobium sp.]